MREDTLEFIRTTVKVVVITATTVAFSALTIWLIAHAAAWKGPGHRLVPNRCDQAAIFQKCLQQLPAGPVTTMYNDWDEVVQQCKYSSIEMAQRITVDQSLELVCEK